MPTARPRMRRCGCAERHRPSQPPAAKGLEAFGNALFALGVESVRPGNLRSREARTGKIHHRGTENREKEDRGTVWLSFPCSLCLPGEPAFLARAVRTQVPAMRDVNCLFSLASTLNANRAFGNPFVLTAGAATFG